MVSGTESRTVEASGFSASRRIWQAEMHTGPDPYADPVLWIEGTTDEDEPERGER